MSERVALVTGAARGIGAAVVSRLADDGVDVVALDWCAGPAATPYAMPTIDDLEQVAHGRPNVLTRVADVRDPAALNSVVDDALSRWGRLDVAVAGAAVVSGGSPLWETDQGELDLLWDIDVRGVWNTAAAVIPAMLSGPAPQGCRFIAIASAAGSHGLYRLAGYTMAKHAVVGLVRGLAADLVGTGISAVAVSPGSTHTQMLAQTAALYGTSVDDLVTRQLLRRPLTAPEVAATIVHCCSVDGAALNGGVVHADGGFSP
ncbi:mycofactocin-coupled SDR family oxidoreductase [Demetria terragena]|uniref:mycofactocin-coupled SDR family oxidoreductase n=1 Tax=Demetria terragena TaxID=63959 RepID=UPI0003685ED6|nr:mycofactocin-coupled SDR family oxidoreductase [Demetria terragena]